MTVRSTARALALLLLPIVVASPAFGQTKLRWKFEKGKKFHYVMSQGMETSASIMDRTFDTSLNQTMDMTWNVVDVQDDGSARMTQTIDRMQITLKGPAGEAKFDSKAPGDVPPQFAVLANLSEALVGKEIGLTMTPRGEVKDVEIPEKVVEALKSVGPSAGGMLSEDGLKNLTSQGSLVFPEEALSAGKTWKKSQKLGGTQVGSMTVDTTYTFTGPAEGSQAGLEKIDADLVMKFESELGIDIKSQDNEASYVFDNKAGVLRSSEVRQVMKMGGQIMGQDFSQDMKTTVTMKLTDGASAK